MNILRKTRRDTGCCHPTAGGGRIWHLATMSRTARLPPLPRSAVDGKPWLKSLDLSKDTETHGHQPLGGGTNHLIVKDGEIWCSEASCPDKVCVHQGKKHLSSDTIVCLPNQDGRDHYRKRIKRRIINAHIRNPYSHLLARLQFCAGYLLICCYASVQIHS
ncbi:MAG: NusG domain II-containing protein [Enterocloster sp.]